MEDKKLSRKIIYNIKARENLSGEAMILPDKENVYEYLLRENIGKIFGKVEFDENEIDMLTTKEGVELTSENGIELLIRFKKSKYGDEISGIIDDIEVFSITTSGSTVSNMVESTNNGIVEKASYSVDTNTADYTYYVGRCAEGEEPKFTYGATLRPVNAKFHDTEIFELIRELPKEEKATSLLKRLVDNLKSDSYIRITTSSELVDVVNFSELIFNRLKLEADKYEKKNSNVVKKDLK